MIYREGLEKKRTAGKSEEEDIVARVQIINEFRNRSFGLRHFGIHAAGRATNPPCWAKPDRSEPRMAEAQTNAATMAIISARQFFLEIIYVGLVPVTPSQQITLQQIFLRAARRTVVERQACVPSLGG